MHAFHPSILGSDTGGWQALPCLGNLAIYQQPISKQDTHSQLLPGTVVIVKLSYILRQIDQISKTNKLDILEWVKM